MTLPSQILLGWSAVVASVTLWAILRSRIQPKYRYKGVGTVLMVRPCTGDEPHLARALLSTASASRSFPMKLRIAVASKADSAFPIAEHAARELGLRGLDARVVITNAAAPNRKADQIARTVAAENDASDVVIIADSDVDFTGLALDDFLAPLTDPQTAATWSAPIEPFSSSIGDRASSALLDASLHSFALLAALDPRGLVGKLVAIRADVLAGIGGFAKLTTHVGEDMELARRLRAAGHATQLSPVRVTAIAQSRSWSAVVERYARWLAVIRAQRPHLLVTYPLLFLATAPIALFSALVVISGDPSAWLSGALAIVARCSVALVARVRNGRPLGVLRLPIDIALADALLWVAFVRATRSRTTTWRGVRLRLGEGGTYREQSR